MPATNTSYDARAWKKDGVIRKGESLSRTGSSLPVTYLEVDASVTGKPTSHPSRFLVSWSLIQDSFCLNILSRIIRWDNSNINKRKRGDTRIKEYMEMIKEQTQKQ